MIIENITRNNCHWAGVTGVKGPDAWRGRDNSDDLRSIWLVITLTWKLASDWCRWLWWPPEPHILMILLWVSKIYLNPNIPILMSQQKNGSWVVTSMHAIVLIPKSFIKADTRSDHHINHLKYKLETDRLVLLCPFLKCSMWGCNKVVSETT